MPKQNKSKDASKGRSKERPAERSKDRRVDKPKHVSKDQPRATAGKNAQPKPDKATVRKNVSHRSADRSTNRSTERPTNQSTNRPTRSPVAEDERINRYLATCGICSRREADRWIAEGRVALNGKTLTQPGVKIGRRDIVTVDGKVVTPAANNTYIMYNKPRGLLCSRKDDRDRPLIYDHLDIPASVQSIGRLDMDSEGLLLLTDNGALAQELTHPRAKIPRQYRVRITSQLSLESLELLRKGGIDMSDGDFSDPWEITVDSETRGHSWVTVTIHRGRWREVRRTLAACGHEVRRLMRTRFGPIKLDLEMPVGAWRTLKADEVKKLKAVMPNRRDKKE